MKELKLLPRFNDTDALGHVNNACYATWFEEARRPVYEIFVPDLNPKNWTLILARIEIDFIAQGVYHKEVLITTKLDRIGNSSFGLHQEAFQDGALICRAKSSLVHYDYKSQKSVPITGELRTKLENL